jgi:hypothetical protein
VSVEEEKLTWTPIEGASYKVLHDSRPVAEVSECSYPLPVDKDGEWQVIAVSDEGVEGFASEPLKIYSQQWQIPVGVKIDEVKGVQVRVEISVPDDGVYALDWLYRNGNGEVNTRNKCSTRTMSVDGKVVGVSVFAQRGADNWSETGWSNPRIVDLTAGTHVVELCYQDENINMNIDVDNSVVEILRVTGLTRHRQM